MGTFSWPFTSRFAIWGVLLVVPPFGSAVRECHASHASVGTPQGVGRWSPQKGRLTTQPCDPTRDTAMTARHIYVDETKERGYVLVASIHIASRA